MPSRRLILPIPRAFALFVLSAGALLGADPERSVVQIVNYSQRPDWIEPWRFDRIGKGIGSGFLIEGGRVMTNAHVVSWPRQILVQRYQDPKPYPAEIEYVGHDCDLAVLRVLDPDFYEGMEPLPIGTLPEVRSTVVTYGYPAGGRQISYTQGVVSRIEIQTYAHIANRSFLTVQTDAAINPGNSGGPVIQNDKVVGVSFQGQPGLENAGFFIPPNVIRHFLEDIEDGHYHGFPDAGLILSPLQNPAFRESLGLNGDSLGARIDRIIHPFPATHDLLRENDVILAVEGYDVGSDGLIQYNGNRVAAAVVFDHVQHGESLQLNIWRDGAAMAMELPVFVNRADRHYGNQYDEPPPYLLLGGLVFTPLSRDYLASLGRNWTEEVSSRLMYEQFFRFYLSEADARREPVVLSKVLDHPVNIDFSVSTGSILDTVNGVPVHSLRDLPEALEQAKDGFHRLVFLSGREEALDTVAAAEATRELIQQYRIPSASRMEAAKP